MIDKASVPIELQAELLKYMSSVTHPTQACYFKRLFLSAWDNFGDIKAAFELWQSSVIVAHPEWMEDVQQIYEEIIDDQVRGS